MSAVRVASLAQLQVPGAVRVVIDGRAVVVARDEDGGVHALTDLCSHADVALSEGDVEGREIECWAHGARFDLVTGRPTCLPAVAPVPVHPVTIDGDDVLVDVTTTVGAAESAGAPKES